MQVSRRDSPPVVEVDVDAVVVDVVVVDEVDVVEVEVPPPEVESLELVPPDDEPADVEVVEPVAVEGDPVDDELEELVPVEEDVPVPVEDELDEEELLDDELEEDETLDEELEVVALLELAPVEDELVEVVGVGLGGGGGGVGVAAGGGGVLMLTTSVDGEQTELSPTYVNSTEALSAQPSCVTSRIRIVLFSPVNVTPINRKSEGSLVHPIRRLSAMARITKLLVAPSRVQVTSP